MFTASTWLLEITERRIEERRVLTVLMGRETFYLHLLFYWPVARPSGLQQHVTGGQKTFNKHRQHLLKTDGSKSDQAGGKSQFGSKNKNQNSEKDTRGAEKNSPQSTGVQSHPVYRYPHKHNHKQRLAPYPHPIHTACVNSVYLSLSMTKHTHTQQQGMNRNPCVPFPVLKTPFSITACFFNFKSSKNKSK